MNQIKEGDLLWTPSPETIQNANITRYIRWLGENDVVEVDGYPQLWRWSIENISDFWLSVWRYFDLAGSYEPGKILTDANMPGAKWFSGARINYAENIFRMTTDARSALIYKEEDKPLQTISWAELYRQTSQLVAYFRQIGVGKGDRVAAYLPNMPQTIVAFLATASLGAIWSSASPDFGVGAVLDRFGQIEPKVLLAVDGYRYAGKSFDRRKQVAKLQANLPALRQTILLPFASENATGLTDAILWNEALNSVDQTVSLKFEPTPFDHPLWILYSSGTTGLPKPIVHGHGGCTLEHVKATVFHNDLQPSDRFFWYSSTGWMMWNYLVGSIFSGSVPILYNGSPAYPDMNALFALAEESGMSYFGASAAFITACINAGIQPNKQFDLSRIRAVGSTGSPLTTAGYRWVYENINPDLALESLSGGTDLCTAFVGGARTMPVYAGIIQGASLGADVRAFNEAGESVIDEVGELVIVQPMPSMPLYFWNDLENARYKESYFNIYAGIWRHGDWIKFNSDGGCVIYGRSDATINRHGVRIGASELYQVVESLPEITDSLVVDLELLGKKSYLPLFVVLADGAALDDALKSRIKQRLRAEVSPRHAPDDIFEIAEIPYTLSGKKMELPIRKILLGQPPDQAAKRGAMRNPKTLDFFIAFAQTLN